MRSDSFMQGVIENLKDAGCDSEMVEKFLSLDREGDIRGQLCLLAGHRQQLLDRVHREERKIDCLDYLAYQLNKKCNAAR